MKKRAILILVVVLLFSVSSACLAETVYLKNGKSVTGELIEKQKNFVKIMVGGIPFMYFTDEIDRIEKGPDAVDPDPGPVNLSGKVEGLRALNQIPNNKKELILRLFEANGARENMTRFFTDTIKKMPEDQKEYYLKILKPSDIILSLLPIYDKYYSESELGELVKFYSSPVGKKFILVSQDLARETAMITIEYFEKRIPGLKDSRQGK